ncbi:predicted protein [Chaetoceros tenuissimus]|uniref:Uncharacterized protein n=1 Tax=Chaetoceros tenuissimus TaxID=426638 RepID=A0AAD3GYE1_9STRA|nr:predicted protein [Chaetoceros tenuissimus]
MTYHETYYASAQNRKQVREESNIRSFVLADEEKKEKAIYAKKLKNQSFYDRKANHETFASAQNRKQAREESKSSTLVEANNSTIPVMDPAQVRRKLLVDEEKNRKAIIAKNRTKRQSFYERLANHETFTSAEPKNRISRSRRFAN